MSKPPSPQHADEDIRWMREALAWSRRGRGWTAPRPSVGCVLVREGRVIGGGHTTPGHGNPHAEIVALRAALAAGEDTRGATAYVTLEPCCHHATTPPCTDALIAAGIVRVVTGVLDPNPVVNGAGYRQLRASGVEVTSGVLADECYRGQEDFLKAITARAPFVTLKCAVSLDGKIATRQGASQWITGEAARRRGHILRHEHDAVLVGIGTVLADDPQLSVRLEGDWKQPARVVLDSSGRLPLTARVLQGAGPLTVYVATTEALPEARRAALQASGAQVISTPPLADRVDLAALCHELYERGVTSILIEGGAQVAGAALAAGIVDKVAFFIAPLLIGDGKSALAGWGTDDLNLAPRLRDVQFERLDDDVLVSGYLKRMEQCLPG